MEQLITALGTMSAFAMPVLLSLAVLVCIIGLAPAPIVDPPDKFPAPNWRLNSSTTQRIAVSISYRLSILWHFGVRF